MSFPYSPAIPVGAAALHLTGRRFIRCHTYPDQAPMFVTLTCPSYGRTWWMTTCGRLRKRSGASEPDAQDQPDEDENAW
jgi:hypothetical protein